MRLNRKTALFGAALMGVMTLVLVFVSLLAFRQFSILSAKAHAQTAAEIVRVGLTQQMVNGVIGKREQFFAELAHVPGLRSVNVVRSPEVVAQFGRGLESERPHDEIESQVLRSGEPYFAVVEEGMQPVFRSTIPYVATHDGSPNCLQCHHVKDGTVLGAVTIRLSIPHLKESAFFTVGVMVLTVAFFGILSLLYVRRLARPLVTTAGEIEEAVASALQGDFAHTVQCKTNDEIGQIARDFNQLNAFLQRDLSAIRDNVAELIQYPASAKGSRNLLTSTGDMVQGLIEVAHFKQAVEEDETRHEVYGRLARVLNERFALSNFSFYEVDPGKNRMETLMIDGEPGRECRWCDPQILVRAESCRVRRTGHDIDDVETPGVCTYFRGGPEHTHICLPIIQSGNVGSVVQLVVPKERGVELQKALPFLSVYTREAAPVLEAKRLMDTLRQSTLHDAMTGLHNRRFLEEYVDTLVASTQRRESRLSLLMLDLDYFKKVNDTYGHDAGDVVLKTLARVLRQSVRSSDMVIRYGGEEFLIILQDPGEGCGDSVAEKIRETVQATKIKLPGAVLEKTISIGVADFPTDSDTFWQAIKFADVALYKAKELGRNRVVHFRPEMWSGDASQY